MLLSISSLFAAFVLSSRLSARVLIQHLSVHASDVLLEDLLTLLYSIESGEQALDLRGQRVESFHTTGKAYPRVIAQSQQCPIVACRADMRASRL